MRRKEGCHPGTPPIRSLGRTGCDPFRLARAHCLPSQVAELMFVIDGIVVLRVPISEIRITAAPTIEVNVLPRIRPAIAWDVRARPKQCSIVLGTDVNIVWLIHVTRDRITLGDREVIHMQPALASIVGKEQPAVVPKNNPIRVEWVAPPGMRTEMESA